MAKKEFYEGIILPVTDECNDEKKSYPDDFKDDFIVDKSYIEAKPDYCYECDNGRYLVYIPELMYFDASEGEFAFDNKYNGVWCYNRINTFVPYVDRIFNSDPQTQSYGSYTPLRPGTQVLVMFDEGVYKYGAIVTIINFEKPFLNRRDDFYIINKTHRGSWIYMDEAAEHPEIGIVYRDALSNIWMNKEFIQSDIKDGPYHKLYLRDKDQVDFELHDSECQDPDECEKIEQVIPENNFWFMHHLLDSSGKYINNNNMILTDGYSSKVFFRHLYDQTQDDAQIYQTVLNDIGYIRAEYFGSGSNGRYIESSLIENSVIRMKTDSENKDHKIESIIKNKNSVYMHVDDTSNEISVVLKDGCSIILKDNNGSHEITLSIKDKSTIKITDDMLDIFHKSSSGTSSAKFSGQNVEITNGASSIKISPDTIDIVSGGNINLHAAGVIGLDGSNVSIMEGSATGAQVSSVATTSSIYTTPSIETVPTECPETPEMPERFDHEITEHYVTPDKETFAQFEKLDGNQ